MQVWELIADTLFVWDAQPHYLHQATDEKHEDGSPIANHIATRTDDGKWRFHGARPQKWNPYCYVREVSIL